MRNGFLAVSFYLTLAVSVFAKGGKEMVPFTKVIQDGGWTMVVLGLLSLFSIFLVVYFFCIFRLSVIFPKEFQAEAEGIATNKDIDALHSLCQGNKSAGAQIVGSVTKILQENPTAEYLVIRDVIEDEGSRQANAFWQKIQYLTDIAVTAPMVGLLGTVLGMIQAFVGLQQDFGAVKPIALASGVSKALVTTAGGLILGIIAMLFYSYFGGHVNGLITQLEERCNQILHQFIFDSDSSSWKTVKK